MRRLAAWSWLGVVLLIAGCAGTTSAHRSAEQLAAIAPAHPDSEIAAIRVVTGNPPRVDIVLLGSDGGLRRVLVRSSARIRVEADRIAWSPDGQWLAFTGTVGRATQRPDLFAVRANGSGLRRVTHTGFASRPVWAPDGHTIVFAAETHFKSPIGYVPPVGESLWRVDSNGAGARHLTAPTEGQLDTPGSFSPDGTRLAFTRINLIALTPVQGAIEVTDPSGSEVHQLAAEGIEPAYSPDGGRVAFVSRRDHNGRIRTGEDESEYAGELYVMDADGHNPRRLTRTSELSEQTPSWSPDGTRARIRTPGRRVHLHGGGRQRRRQLRAADRG